MTFTFHHDSRAKVVIATSLGSAKRIATREMNPRRPGKWIERKGKTLFADGDGSPKFDWKNFS